MDYPIGLARPNDVESMAFGTVAALKNRYRRALIVVVDRITIAISSRIHHLGSFVVCHTIQTHIVSIIRRASLPLPEMESRTVRPNVQALSNVFLEKCLHPTSLSFGP